MSSRPSDAQRRRDERQAQKDAQQVKRDRVRKAGEPATKHARTETEDGNSDEVLRICEERAFARGYMAGATDMRDDYQKVLDSHSEYVHDLFKDKTVYDHIADVLNHDLPEEECDIACIRQQRRTR